jgi:hypothetical protein
MYGSHYLDKPPKVSGDEWEEKTFQTLKQLFPNIEIKKQVRFSELPHAIIDFYVPNIRIAIECKACGLTPVPRKCDDNCALCGIAKKCVLLNHNRRQNILKSLNIKYVWWVDRERASLVPRTRKHLENVFYNCLGEQEKFELFLKQCYFSKKH